jgi:hypothetical protein
MDSGLLRGDPCKEGLEKALVRLRAVTWSLLHEALEVLWKPGRVLPEIEEVIREQGVLPPEVGLAVALIMIAWPRRRRLVGRFVVPDVGT